MNIFLRDAYTVYTIVRSPGLPRNCTPRGHGRRLRRVDRGLMAARPVRYHHLVFVFITSKTPEILLISGVFVLIDLRIERGHFAVGVSNGDEICEISCYHDSGILHSFDRCLFYILRVFCVREAERSSIFLGEGQPGTSTTYRGRAHEHQIPCTITCGAIYSRQHPAIQCLQLTVPAHTHTSASDVATDPNAIRTMPR